MIYYGVVESRKDPLKLGRVQVRVMGLHSHDTNELKTEDLPWAIISQGITSAAISGIGHTPLGLVEGSWVLVIFNDSDFWKQEPIIIGTIAGIPTIDNDGLTVVNDSLDIKDQEEEIRNSARLTDENIVTRRESPFPPPVPQGEVPQPAGGPTGNGVLLPPWDPTQPASSGWPFGGQSTFDPTLAPEGVGPNQFLIFDDYGNLWDAYSPFGQAILEERTNRNNQAPGGATPDNPGGFLVDGSGELVLDNEGNPIPLDPEQTPAGDQPRQRPAAPPPGPPLGLPPGSPLPPDNKVSPANFTGKVNIEFNGVRKASNFNASQRCLDLIKSFESLASSVKGSTVIVPPNAPDDTIIYAYRDVTGTATIGYGSTFIDGRRVTLNDQITKKRAEELLMDELEFTFVPSIRRNVSSIVTQSMFDACVSLAYNLGSTGFAKSSVASSLNSTRYEEAANNFNQYVFSKGERLTGLVRRRDAEKRLFLQDGIPGEDPPTNDAPVGEENEDGTVSDGGAGSETQRGFSDPNGKYPTKDYLNEQDVNRLARAEYLDKTIVYKKDAARVKEVITAYGVRWTQSPNPYNAIYPFNHVYQSESGHVLEFDDTPNSERINLYHKAGTFIEIDANGTMVRRIVGDSFEILERNGNILIKGGQNVTINGTQNIRVENGYNLEIEGVANISVYNDARINVSGNASLAAKGDLDLRGRSVTIASETDLFLAGNGNTTINAGGRLSVRSSGNMAIDGDRVDINNQLADAIRPVPGSRLKDPNEEIEDPDLPELTLITRQHESNQYETPEEGNPQDFILQEQVEGTVDPLEVDSNNLIDETEAVGTGTVLETEPNNNRIDQMEDFPGRLKLSENFTLYDLTKNGTRMPVAQQGLTKQEIVGNLKNLCVNVLEPIYQKYPNMIITSGFRRPQDVPNSSPTSDHYLGCAVDIVLSGYDREKHFEAIKDIRSTVPHDQLILEYIGQRTVWIHISYKYNRNRFQAFTMDNHRRVSAIGEFRLLA